MCIGKGLTFKGVVSFNGLTLLMESAAYGFRVQRATLGEKPLSSFEP